MDFDLIYEIKSKGEFYLEPWPHVIVNQVLDPKIADLLGENWPDEGVSGRVGKKLQLTKESAPNEAWKNFYDTIITKQGQDLNLFMCETFKNFCTPFESETPFDEIALRLNEEPEERMIKNWHVDNARKKFTGIMYFENPVGRLELSNCETTKSIEPKHNMYVFWAASEETVHRFFAGPGTRKSLSLSAHYPRANQSQET